MTSIPLTLTRGSDLDVVITFPDEAGSITGWTFSIIDVSWERMIGQITCVVLDGPAKTARLYAPWSALWPPGTARLTFYVKPSGLENALPQFRIDLE